MHAEFAQHRGRRAIARDAGAAVEYPQCAAGHAGIRRECGTMAFATLAAMAMTDGLWRCKQFIADGCAKAAALVDPGHVVVPEKDPGLVSD